MGLGEGPGDLVLVLWRLRDERIRREAVPKDPDALAILGDAAEILRRYPELRVEVAGHTDLCGPEAYNQKLSERRAKTVYDYLATNGIDSSRLSGPVGYGESRPLVSTPQTMPGCKSEENRRTELNVQN